MHRLLGIFFILGITLASGTYDSSHLRNNIRRRVEDATSQLRTEVGEATNRLKELVEIINNPAVRRVAELYKRNRDLLDLCEGTADLDLQGAASCINLTGDIANVTTLLLYGYELGYDVSLAVINIVSELNTCASEHVWQQVGCYKNAFQDIQDTIKEYSLECSQFVQNTTEVVQQIQVDVSKCFKFTDSISEEVFENRVHLCKLELYM